MNVYLYLYIRKIKRKKRLRAEMVRYINNHLGGRKNPKVVLKLPGRVAE